MKSIVNGFEALATGNATTQPHGCCKVAQAIEIAATQGKTRLRGF
ncbi:MAG: hypothetical protein AAB571_13240 [Chloroflexota bacterium]